MRMSRALFTVVAPLSLTTALLAGCGGTGSGDPEASPSPTGPAALSAQELLDQASSHSGATSFRMSGDLTADGQTITVDMKVDGENVDGTITTGQGELRLRKVGSDVYIQAGAEFWGQFAGDAAAALLQGKWMKTSAGDTTFGDMSELANVGNVSDLLGASATTKTELTEIDGVPAIGVTGKDGTVLYVAIDGQPRPLRLVGPDGQGQLDFTDYGASYDIAAPPAEEVLDINALTGG